MNIAVQRQVVGVLVHLGPEEAEQFLKNPRKLQEEVGGALRGTASLGQDDVESMARLVIGDRAVLALPAPGKAFRNYPKGSRKPGRGRKATSSLGAKKAGRSSAAAINCPECGKPAKGEHGLNIHMARAHPEVAQARKDFKADPV